MFTYSRPILGPLAAALLIFAGNLAGAEPLRIAVAANFTDTTRYLIALFEETTGHSVAASYGSTGKLYAQIENGAPFDVFQAADSERPQMLENTGGAVAGSRFTYARGRLALWSPEPDVFSDPQNWLASADFKRLAIANPKTAPYGLAAQQVLENMSLWDALQPRLVRGDSIAQAFQFVATSNAQAGFVALSQVNAWQNSNGTLWVVPQQMYAPINQQTVLLNHGKDKPVARQWLEFLRSPQALKIIKDYGYDIPD
ncbi:MULTISPECIES: molybdate ABC transporter substrate-binding protein [unclassified Marinobacter]|jgi:molybdate transport system substrate-binding protein|uniref:molybdate ABC transporter substrate-binding protein n=1 Tax=unclassified Marinobacter TaxID=83889 RepID=UPI002010261A|nr:MULTISPECIES: molybdate ABC transporter substrate-binding protein [unclassified Marinobacter]MCL1478181.1 molybdate ABC transporter substrate-binding protein [Marinobacter sp.]MCL1480137.1 molybdate ABC transporter substrate-binding protein [Marinobacter sp.]MCL1483986.1 molybdate ABC transporter substrate-binding protein [Marinobacter sp.]MCL1486914.1 molybdate ABC transporter substrate-binding protein [Marinobacter sp.]UQG55663.1 molybdate ABC transporter substrate-binding protein [Marino